MCMPQRKTKFQFLDKGSAKPSFVQLKWTFTRSNRYQTMSFFLEFVPVNLCTMEELRLRIVVERGNKANVYIVNIFFITAFLGIFKHSLIFLNDASKSVSPEKKIKKETQKVSVAGFDSLRNVSPHFRRNRYHNVKHLKSTLFAQKRIVFQQIKTLYMYIYIYSFFPTSNIYITLYFNVSSTLLRKNRNTDFLYIYIYIYVVCTKENRLHMLI